MLDKHSSAECICNAFGKEGCTCAAPRSLDNRMNGLVAQHSHRCSSRLCDTHHVDGSRAAVETIGGLTRRTWAYLYGDVEVFGHRLIQKLENFEDELLQMGFGPGAQRFALALELEAKEAVRRWRSTSSHTEAQDATQRQQRKARTAPLPGWGCHVTRMCHAPGRCTKGARTCQGSILGTHSGHGSGSNSSANSTSDSSAE